MACLRVVVQDWGAYGQNVPFRVKLDCWAAFIRVGGLTTKGEGMVNGADMFDVWQYAAPRLIQVTFPGLSDQHGLPINYNEELVILFTRAYFAGITKVYYDPDRPDADPRIEAVRDQYRARLLNGATPQPG